jgi:hypothetical protein
VYTSDSLETIFSHLSTRVVNAIAGGNCLQDLRHLLEFLAAWEKRPGCLTPMAYQWCSAISEAAERLEWDGWSTPSLERKMLLQLRVGPLGSVYDILDARRFAEGGFSKVGCHCDIFRSDDASHRPHGPPQDLSLDYYANLLPVALEIGFRLVTSSIDQPVLYLNHTPHHDRMFDFVFSSDDDEVIADAVSTWIVDGDRAPPGSCVHYLAGRAGSDDPLSARLRRVTIHTIERIQHSELEVSGSEIIYLLNRLDVNVGDMMKERVWVQLLVRVIYLPAGLEGLSSHYWCLLAKLSLVADFSWIPGSCSMEVMRSLKIAEDWERLEVWMVVVWQSVLEPASMCPGGNIERVTLELLLRRASAVPRFERLCVHGSLYSADRKELQHICDGVRAGAEQLLPAPPPPYVSVHPSQHPSVLMPPFARFSQSVHAQPSVTLSSVEGDTF